MGRLPENAGVSSYSCLRSYTLMLSSRRPESNLGNRSDHIHFLHFLFCFTHTDYPIRDAGGSAGVVEIGNFMSRTFRTGHHSCVFLVRSLRLRAPDKALSKIFEALKRAELASTKNSDADTTRQPERRRTPRVRVHIPLLVYGYKSGRISSVSSSSERNGRGALCVQPPQKTCSRFTQAELKREQNSRSLLRISGFSVSAPHGLY
jgi:hypothetical protein